MTFYLKYRPQKLEDLVILDARESLKKIISSGNIPHAFLFSGPKGTGKTSAARILAKILNCEKKGNEPCNKCEQCISITKGSNIDVIELDAASNRGIDDVRALRDAVKLSPAMARRKVYIIDEAHMLTTEASNALLKTLEEPPAHVTIILATTNPEKLIETIRSRTTNISFRKANNEEIVLSLGRIVKAEKIKIDKEGLNIIAKAAGGSFRDATKLLEQVTSERTKLDETSIAEFISKKKTFDIDEFITILSKKDTKAGLLEISNIVKKGGSIETLTTVILTKFREGLLAKVGIGEDTLTDFSKEDLLYLIELFTKSQNELKVATIEELPVEIAVIKWGEIKDGQSESTHVEINSPSTEGGTGLASSHSRDIASPTLDSSSQNLAQTKISNVRGNSPAPKSLEGVNDEVWRKILELIRPINASIEALLRAARPVGYDGKILTLGVFYRFHKERLEDIHHRKILEDIVTTVLGSPIRIMCVLTDPPPKQIVEEVKKDDSILTEGGDKDIIKVAEEIFGN